MHRWLSWAGTVVAGTMALSGLAACGGATSNGGLGGGGDPDAAGAGGDAGGGTVLPAGVVATLDDQPIALSVIDGKVYVALFIDGIVSVPTSGGTVTSLVPSVSGYTPDGVYFQNAFVHDGTNLYFSESSGGDTTGAVAFAPIGGGTPTVLASSLGFTAGIASDASNVYWVDQDQGTIRRVPLGGGTATVLASGLKTPGGLALQNGTLYLTDAAGDLLSVPASGGSVTTLLAGPGLPPNTELADYSPTVVTDASNAYFSVCPEGGTGTPALYRVPLGNGGPPVVLASSCAGGIAVDADTVYWTTSQNTINAVPIAGGATRVVATSSQGISGGPAVDDEDVYWGVTPQVGSCGLCPPPPQGQVNAIMRAPKGVE